MFKLPSFLLVTKVLIATLVIPVFHVSQAKEFHEKITEAQVVSNLELLFSDGFDNNNLSLTAGDTQLQFTLENNNQIIGDNVLLSNQIELYKGQIIGNPDSWARFTSINGVITGAFFDGETLYLLNEFKSVENTLSNSLQNRTNMMRRSSAPTYLIIDADKVINSGTCGLHDHSEVERFGYREYVNELREMTQSASSIGEIQINLIADTEFVSFFTDPITNVSTASAEMLSHLNIADGIFNDQLNIQFVASETTELTVNGSLTPTEPVELIQAFRFSDFPNPGLRHLFTGKNLDGTTVGIAFVNSLCRQSSVGVTQRDGALTSLIFAHELGHNFGSPHDGQAGSVCANEPAGFVMFPNIRGAGEDFSACSVTQMLPVIENATFGPGACITEIVLGSAPVILSTPNESATVGQAYAYDSDNAIDLEDPTNASFNLDIAPEGMVLDENGTIVWTPNANQLGLNAVQITVTNEFGSITQFFEVLVEPASNVIDFSLFTIEPFSAEQDQSGGAAIGETNFELVLNGNAWKSIAFEYLVKPNTVLEFEFFSDVEAEIQGIAFETDTRVSPSTSFEVFGTQNWGVGLESYTQIGSYQTIRIPVGTIIQGQFSKLVFILDNDANIAGANARFRNVRVFDEEITPGEPIDLSVLAFSAHSASQDVEGTALLTDEGFGLEMIGNRWRSVVLEGQSITPNTLLSFEFRSSSEGEIHGIGFLPAGTLNQSRAFNIYGTQNWGIQDFSYTGNGEYQTFIIPIGQYFTQSPVEMVFIMDHDVTNPSGVSQFRNVSLFEISN